MKKNIFIVILGLLIIFIAYINIGDKNLKDDNIFKDEVRAMYISYIELSNHLCDKSASDMKKEIDTMIDNLKNDQFNLLILHVRSFSDAIYFSDIYPPSIMITGSEEEKLPFDILEYFIEKAHQVDIKVHAWINPYRIRSSNSKIPITVKNPAFWWLGTNNIDSVKDSGIYYNPASDDVLELLLSGIRELIDNYDIDGIHFDDYFYPSDDIDSENYQKYRENGGLLTLKEFHYNVILNMIKEVHNIIVDSKKDILFGIAPDGNIDNNYDTHYLDIKKLLEEDYIDYIMPQIYYGFFNEVKPFIETVNEWNNLIKNKNIKLYPALAFYKSGNKDTYAKSGVGEWMTYSKVITNQIRVSRNMSMYGGYCLYRYDYFYSPDNNFQTEEVMNYRILFMAIA